ncbi:MAG: hypothetical protein ABSG51_15215 [Terracidiphilus sp.]|jgi:hypothetical protein
MSDEPTLMIAREHLRTLRTRVLINLDRAYPSTLEDVIIRSMESESLGLRTIRRELHYMADKGFVSIEADESGSLHAAITGKGRDLVMGEFEEMGIESAGSYGYTGK